MNNKFILILFSLYLSGNKAISQNTFQKVYNPYSIGMCGIAQTNDDGYLIMGKQTIKTNAFGDTLWTKVYDFGLSNQLGAQITLDGGFVIAGSTMSAGAGNLDFFLSKYDSLGNPLWARVYGASSYEDAFSMCQTSDSGFVIVGRTNIFSASSGFDIYIVKTDMNGHLLWTRTLGGNSNDITKSVKPTQDGNIIIGGNTASLGNFQEVALTIKMDLSGNIIWAKAYDGYGQELMNDIYQTSDQGYIFTGSIFGFTNLGNVIVLFKTDSTGDLKWSRYYNDEILYSASVNQTKDGGYMVAGQITYSNSNTLDACLLKCDSAGGLEWAKSYGDSATESAFFGVQTKDNGFAVLAQTLSFGTGNYLIKTDSLGNSGCYQMSMYVTTIDSSANKINVNILNVVDTIGVENPFIVNVGYGTWLTPLCIDILNVENLAEENFLEIFPNPSIGKFNIRSTENINNGLINILDIQGRIIYSNVISNSSLFEIDLKEIQTGIYFVRIFDGKESYTRKIIIE